MSKSQQDSDSNLSILLFGLLISCPCNRATENCPLTELRKQKSLEDKFELANHLSPIEVREMIEYHNTCFSTRLRSSLGRRKPSYRQREYNYAARE